MERRPPEAARCTGSHCVQSPDGGPAGTLGLREARGPRPPRPASSPLGLCLGPFSLPSRAEGQCSFSLGHKHMISTWKCGNLDAFVIATD